MGGGDLNLKKSWHPSTLRNIERVWKAEQKHEVEKQKIEQLQKELAEERAREEIQTFAEDQGVVRKREERLDWMYQGPAAMVNREEYLMGRKIDKTLEILEHQESGTEPKKDDFDVGSSMFSSQDLSGTATVDLANKIREDPLFSIMKKEKEQRKNLLCNPVKMKQLQQMLKESLNKGKKKKSKKNKNYSDSDTEEKKSYKKHKKHKHHKSNSSDSEHEKISLKNSTEDYYKKSKKFSAEDDKYERKRSASSSYQEYHRDDHSWDKEHHSSKYGSKNSDDHFSRYKEQYHSSKYGSRNGDEHFSRDKEQYHSTKYGSKNGDEHFSRDKEQHHSSKYGSKNADEHSSRDKEHHSSKYLSKNSDNNFSKGSYSSKESYSRRSLNSNHKEKNIDSSAKRKFNEEERERRLREMEDNAKWRDEQREKNVKRYREEDEEEVLQNHSHKIDASDFIKPMLSKAAGKGSLENRVKQKIFSIQRSRADMDKNFAKR